MLDFYNENENVNVNCGHVMHEIRPLLLEFVGICTFLQKIFSSLTNLRKVSMFRKIHFYLFFEFFGQVFTLQKLWRHARGPVQQQFHYIYTERTT